jgi:hypothetical protein
MASNEIFRDFDIRVCEPPFRYLDWFLASMCLLQVFAFERAVERHFAFGPAAESANVAGYCGASTSRPSFAADLA